MILNWYGHACFKAQGNQSEQTVVIDPYDASIGLKIPRLSGDVVVVTDDSPAYNNWQQIKSSEHSPFLIQYPGEYEVRGIFATAVAAKKKSNETTLLLSMGIDDIVLGHLGCIDRALTEQELDALGRIDILLLPVGGGSTLSGRLAVEVLKQIEPRIVVPMQYKIPGLKSESEPLEIFLKEYGIKDPEKADKLKMLRRDLPSDETRVVVLNIS